VGYFTVWQIVSQQGRHAVVSFVRWRLFRPTTTMSFWFNLWPSRYVYTSEIHLVSSSSPPTECDDCCGLAKFQFYTVSQKRVPP